MSTFHKALLILVGLALVPLLLLVVFGDKGFVDLHRARDLRDRIRSENREIAKENLRLNREVHRLKSDPAYVEHVARRELGMVGRGEMVIRLGPETGKGTAKTE